MEFTKLAEKRISCRNYSHRSVPTEEIVKLLDAARNAPSAGNIQPWFFYVAADRAVIQNMHGTVFQQEWISEAPVLIIACANRAASEEHYGERGRDVYAYMDCAAAIQNLLLCATDLKLDSCWIGDFDVAECARFIGREQYTPLALITIGYAKSSLAKTYKKPLSEICQIVGAPTSSELEEEPAAAYEMKCCDLSHAVFEDVNLHQCSIDNANMYQASINNVNLREATIQFCNLEEVQIIDCLVGGLTVNGKKWI